MLVRPLSTVDNTRDYARVSHSRQWSNYNVTHIVAELIISVLLGFDLVYCLQVTVNFGPHFKFPPQDQPQCRPVCNVYLPVIVVISANDDICQWCLWTQFILISRSK